MRFSCKPPPRPPSLMCVSSVLQQYTIYLQERKERVNQPPPRLWNIYIAFRALSARRNVSEISEKYRRRTREEQRYIEFAMRQSRHIHNNVFPRYKYSGGRKKKKKKQQKKQLLPSHSTTRLLPCVTDIDLVDGLVDEDPVIPIETLFDGIVDHHSVQPQPRQPQTQLHLQLDTSGHELCKHFYDLIYPSINPS